MFAAVEPEEMLIDEVEAIWSAIEADDDWGPLEAKLQRLREAGQAWGFSWRPTLSSRTPRSGDPG